MKTMQSTDVQTDLSMVFSALADPTRRAILARLAAGEAPVKDLAEPFALSGPAITKHLKVLDRAGSVMEALPSVRQCSESPSRASLPSVVRRAEVRRRLGMLREASALVEGAPEGETLPELSWVRAQIALDRGDLVDARRSFEAVAFAAQAASDHLGSQRAMAERLALACSPTERTMWRGLLQAQESMHPDATPALREVQWAMAQALACEGDRAAAGRLHEAVARALEGQTSAESAAAALASARARPGR